jgi:hypothetical protein
MPKLRNADTELGKFVQWVGRKCRNHNPLEELGIEASARPSTYVTKYKGKVYVEAGDETVLYYRAKNRVFVLRAEEITDQDVQEKNLVAVGF